MPNKIPAYYTDEFILPLPPGHRFPMGKYRRIRQLLSNGPIAHRLDFRIPPSATDAELSSIHDPDYIQRVSHGELTDRDLDRLGFPWSPQLAERSRRSVGATIAAARHALEGDIGISLAGGTHHARANAGHGYCVFNDCAVALSLLRQEGRISTAAILDLDVHQGNGSALLFADQSDIRTISINEAPATGRYAHPSDLDIDLPHGTGDADYLQAVKTALDYLDSFSPDLIAYIAGADPSTDDILGQLSVSPAALKQRDQIIFTYCYRRRLPIVLTMGGGYMPDVDHLGTLHATTVETAVKIMDNQHLC